MCKWVKHTFGITVNRIIYMVGLIIQSRIIAYRTVDVGVCILSISTCISHTLVCVSGLNTHGRIMAHRIMCMVQINTYNRVIALRTVVWVA